jgi:conjugal transfer/type IV secretion protein DotA/TraY
MTSSISNMRILTIFLVLILQSTPVIAKTGPFSVPATDKSVALLGYVFGSHVGGVNLVGDSNPALIHMFELLNIISLSLGTIILTYVGVVATVNTAQEGQVMGKKMSSPWIHMRSTIGMLLMVPTPATGYSVIQSTVMWLILQGIGAADQLWNTVLEDLGHGLSATAAGQLDKTNRASFDRLDTDGSELTEQLLRSTICMAALNEPGFMDWPHKHIRLFNGHTTRGPIANGYRVSSTMYLGIKGDQDLFDICGSYEVEGHATAGDWGDVHRVNDTTVALKAQEIFDQKQLALHFMTEALMPAAQAIVREQAQPRRNDNPLNSRLLDIPDGEEYPIHPAGSKRKAVNTYIKILSSLKVPQKIDELTYIVDNGRRDGWISAGSFYFTLNMVNAEVLFPSTDNRPIGRNIPHCDTVMVCNDFMPDNAAHVLNDKLLRFLPHQDDKFKLGTRLWDAKIYLKHDNADVSTSLNTKPGVAAALTEDEQFHQDAISTLLPLFTEEHSDPIIAQGQFGLKLMNYSENEWQKDLDRQRGIINEAAQNDTFSREVMNVLDRLRENAALNLKFTGILWLVGATLAIYVPLIPYMIFVIATLGWLLLVIEAVVAAPILAVSLMLPAGEELGKIVNGLMLLLNIMLRPTLMLFGFVLASRVYRAIIELVNYSMLGNLSNLNTSGSSWAWVAIIAFYGAFILALSNKCFALIYVIPDKILRWMGGSPEYTDVQQEMGQAKGALSKGGETMSKIGIGSAEAEINKLRNRANQAGQPADEIRGLPDNRGGGQQGGGGQGGPAE